MWYRMSGGQSVDNGGNYLLGALLPLLAGGVPGLSGGHLTAAQTGSGGSFFSRAVSSFLGNQPAVSNVPQAGVYWMLLDEQFGWQVGNGSGSEPVGSSDQYKHYVRDCSNPIQVQQSGYIYIYTANQSNIDVYFDNLQVSHLHSALLEETHYYPFGLTMAGISSKAAGKLENRNKFNDGTELTSDLNLSLYETPFRQYDPQLGRFSRIDPMADDYEDWTPYNYSINNPVLLNDPTGLTPGFEDDEKKRAAHNSDMDVTVTAKRRLNTKFWLQNVNRAADGTYHIKAGGNYSQRSLDFLQSRTDFQNKRLEFNNATETVVKEGLMFAVPWGRAIKGVAWLYRLNKARQAGKLLSSRIARNGLETSASFVTNTFKKVLENGGDASKIDWSDVTLSSVNPLAKYKIWGSLGTETINSLVDYKSSSGFQIVGYDKRTSDVLVDLQMGLLKGSLKGTFNELGGKDFNRDLGIDVLFGNVKSEVKSVFKEY